MPSRDPAAAADGYETWLTEKLWELIPPYVRAEDTLTSPPGALRRLVQIIGENAAEIRRSQDRLWDDNFIETADPWAVPYLGELVGSRLLQAILDRAQRIDVAKTIYYRRRAGTLRVLEELVADITGREGVVREQFRRLARAAHLLEPPPVSEALTGTPAHGFANLRNPAGSELAGGPFDEFHHTPDLRRPRGLDGRYGIQRLAVYRYRLADAAITGALPRQVGTFYTFDPSGRDVPLFARRDREADEYNFEAWRTAREAELPLPIRCRLLGAAPYLLTDDAAFALLSDPDYLAIATPALAAFVDGIRNVRIESDARLRTTLSAYGASALLTVFRRHALVVDCGRAVLLDADEPALAVLPNGSTAMTQEEIAAGRVEIGTTAPFSLSRNILVDPERGRFVLGAGVALDRGAIGVTYRYGYVHTVGAGPWDRSVLPWAADPPELPSVTVSNGDPITLVAEEEVVLADNRTYTSVTPPAVDFAALRWSAAEQTRPYVRLTVDLLLTGGTADEDGVLVLDGLWFGADGATRRIVLRGDFRRVEIRACTFDPGGTDAIGGVIYPVELRVDGFVELLVVQSSIVGRIGLGLGGAIETLCMADTIVDDGVLATHENVFDVGVAEVRLTRVTVLGALTVHRLWASETIIAGTANVFDTQNGCFRFSAAHVSSRDHLPHPYESAYFSDSSSLFVSLRWGDPGYAQLSDTPIRLSGSPDDLDALASIVSGAEDDGEMGAYHDRFDGLAERALVRKHVEYTPFGLLSLFVHET